MYFVIVAKISRRCSSVVEHVIGNDGVESPILFSGTINKKRHPRGCLFLLIRITERSGLSTRLRKQSESSESTSPSANERGGRDVTSDSEGQSFQRHH